MPWACNPSSSLGGRDEPEQLAVGGEGEGERWAAGEHTHIKSSRHHHTITSKRAVFFWISKSLFILILYLAAHAHGMSEEWLVLLGASFWSPVKSAAHYNHNWHTRPGDGAGIGNTPSPGAAWITDTGDMYQLPPHHGNLVYVGKGFIEVFSSVNDLRLFKKGSQYPWGKQSYTTQKRLLFSSIFHQAKVIWFLLQPTIWPTSKKAGLFGGKRQIFT